MGYFKTVEGLTEEQCKTYQTAIRRGYFRGYDLTWRSKTFTNAFIWKYPNRFTVINILHDMVGHDPRWEDITDVNLMTLGDTLDEDHAPLSVKTMMAQVNALIKDYELGIDIPSKNHDRICSRKGDVSQAVYLDMDELKKFMVCQCENIMEHTVQRTFLIECFTGARWCDAQTIDISNYNEETNTIRYYSKKNRRDLIIPCHELLLPILQEPSLIPAGKMLLSSYNKTLRELCRRSDIVRDIHLHRRGMDCRGEKWQFISSHTGRRSFATNLFMKGIAVDTICQLMGHASPSITMNYIKDRCPLDNDLIQAFKA